MKEQILRYNTRNGVSPSLSPFFEKQLDTLITFQAFTNDVETLKTKIVSDLQEYKDTHKINNIVLGMSGGIDSALTASLFKQAGWNVTGVTLPINQNPEETSRGIEACNVLGLEHIQVDLTNTYEAYLSLATQDVDKKLFEQDFTDKSERVRAGNIRARLRMITLYNLASLKGGIVGSTDNFSELSAGFWTLHGDVGDVAPIQSLTKSWEVPFLAEAMGVPKSIIEATPTDGLGVDAGDEAQFGFTYLHFDIVLLSLLHPSHSVFKGFENASEEDNKIIESVKSKIKGTVFKRLNPVNLDHPIRGSALYQALSKLDDKLLKEV